VAFAAIRVGEPWLKGRAIVIRSLNQLIIEFPTAWQCLSPDGVYEKRLLSLLSRDANRSLPGKLSSNLLHYPFYRYKSELQTNLRALAELLLEDVVSTDAVRAQFYRE
jgi:hypothetical protein